MADREINSPTEYGSLYESDKARSEAFKIALETRQFELDLYWKRAAYFWAFTAVVFAGYFAVLVSSDSKLPDQLRQEYLLTIASLGLCLSWGWFLAIRGGKYWTSNWELHVDYLEEFSVGPLFKTVLNKDKLNKWDLLKAFPHSVGRVNQTLSLLIVLIWFFLCLRSAVALFNLSCILSILKWLPPVFSLCFMVILWRRTETDFQARNTQTFVTRSNKRAKETSTQPPQDASDA